MKVFLSHPMHGLSEDEIKAIRTEALVRLQTLYGNVELIDNYHHEDAPENAGRLWHLGRSIQQMSDADAVYFCEGSCLKAKGCRVELKVAQLYGIEILN